MRTLLKLPVRAVQAVGVAALAYVAFDVVNTFRHYRELESEQTTNPSASD